MTLPEQLPPLLVDYLPVLTITGVVMALLSTIAIPWLVIRMPHDYFVDDSKPPGRRGVLGWTVWCLRNLVAIVLLLAGIAMLVLPGQGLLTIMIGIACSTFPGKFRLQRRLVSRPGVLHALNWIRRKYQRPPLLAPEL